MYVTFCWVIVDSMSAGSEVIPISIEHLFTGYFPPDYTGLYSLQAEFSQGKTKRRGKKEISASPWCVLYHACTGVSLTTTNVLVTCDTTEQPGLHENKCELRNFNGVSTGHAHFTLNETDLEKQWVSKMWSATTWKNALRASRCLSFFLFFSLAMRDLC